MCNLVQIKTSASDITKRFKAAVQSIDDMVFAEELSGFTHPVCPVITNRDPALISSEYSWGLIPFFCKDESIRKNTLNARIETLDEKPAFRSATFNRCLVIATGFYEWRWNDQKGKSKTKFRIHSAEDEIFAFAGLYSEWTNPTTNELLKTFSIVTTDANPQMQYIHNNKKRMPVLLNPGDEPGWLDVANDVSEFAFPRYDPKLIAFPC